MKQFLFIGMLLLVGCTRSTKPVFKPFDMWPDDSLKYVLETRQLTNELEMLGSGMLGIRYNSAGKYDSARLYLIRALNLPGGKEYQGGRLITNLANSYGFEGQYTEALKYYMSALQTSERLLASNKYHDLAQLNIVRTMANLAEIYYLTGNQKQALYYAEQAREREKNEKGEWSYITPQYLYIIGSILLNKGEWDEAGEIMRETYKIADIICRGNIQHSGNPNGMYMYVAYGKEGQAQVFLAQKDYAKALEYATEALRYAELHGDPSIIAKMLSSLSDIYLAQGNHEKSGWYAWKALEVCPDYAKLNPGTEFNIAITSLFAGSVEKAYEYFRLYSERMKENTDKQFHETMAGMEVIYETEKKEARINSLEKERQLYVWLAIVGILFVSALVIVLCQIVRNARKEKQFIATRSVLDGEMRERARLAQDLHDRLSGSLSAVKLELGSHAETLQSVRNKLDNCIRDIRDAAHGLMPISLQSGLKIALEDFAAQFSNVRFHFFGQEKRIDERLEFVVYCCASELVNNAIKHSGAKTINLQLVQDEKYVTLTVSDNGSGFDEKNVTKGFGLKSIRDRITSCNGKIDTFTSPGKGTETTIELKFEN